MMVIFTSAACLLFCNKTQLGYLLNVFINTFLSFFYHSIYLVNDPSYYDNHYSDYGSHYSLRENVVVEVTVFALTYPWRKGKNGVSPVLFTNIADNGHG